MIASATRNVLIRGDGVAACCCAHLLKNAGLRVMVERPDRPRVPAIMLSDPALALIRDVFGQPSLFSRLPRIERRVVAWGADAEPVSLTHSAAVVSETLLLESLGRGFTADPGVYPDFTIRTSRPLPSVAAEKRFGSRRAAAAQVALRDETDRSTCWIESLEEGWLFLIPNASESTWLLAVGAALESLLARSRVIARRVNLLGGRSGEFVTCPRIVTPLCGDGWLACGTVAMAFDPICGDGTAQAIREAILAAAVVRGIAEGGDAPSLFSHYETRLTAAMGRHLALCAEFYRSGGTGPWWQAELESLAAGYRWCASKLAGAGEPRYRLRDFVLECRQ
jgi:2-polyprenyl-6-methoxyphenol hydroxylase-like FAD-dependent oxidoreductase